MSNPDAIDPAEALRAAAFGLADQLRRCGPDDLAPSELVTLRAWMSTLEDEARVRVVFPSGDSIIEGPIDRLWDTLGRQPTAGEYRALAKIGRETAVYCEEAAAQREKEERTGP